MSDVQRVSIAFNVQIRSFEAADGEPEDDDKEVAVMTGAPTKTVTKTKSAQKKAALKRPVLKKATGKKTSKKSAKDLPASKGSQKLPRRKGAAGK